MKKIAFLGLCATVAVAASAQISVVKDAERLSKAEKFDEAAKTIQPAFTNPESANDAYTYFVAGKNGIDQYTALYLNKTIGKSVDGKKMGHALIDGYTYLLKVLPLDSVTDAKGKVKTKYSKNTVKLIGENYSSLNNAALFLWDEKDFKGAYDAWEMLLTLPSNPVLGKNAPKAYPDTTAGEIYFNQALAAWQVDSLALSLASLEKAIELGYSKSQAFDYAINHAARLGLNEKVYDLADKAYAKFGNENPLYLQLKINGLIDNNRFDEASTFLNAAIAENPNDGQLYNIQGILFEQMKENDKAKGSYKVATEKSPENIQALYNYARMLCNDAYKLSDEAQSQNLSNSEYQAVRENKIDPIFREAAVYLEKALELDKDNQQPDIRKYLRNIYYNLGDEENLKRIENY